MKINHASTMLNAIERLHGDVAEYKIREGKSLPCSVWVASTKQNINANLPEENFFFPPSSFLGSCGKSHLENFC